MSDEPSTPTTGKAEPAPEPPEYTGHDFTELVTADVVPAEALTLMLRSRGIDARTLTAGGWTIGGPSDKAAVFVPAPMLAEARTHIKDAVVDKAAGDERSRVDWEPREGTVVPRCPTCGYVLEGLARLGQCPECANWFMLPETEPVASAEIHKRRERMRPFALAMLLIVIAIILVSRGMRPWF